MMWSKQKSPRFLEEKTTTSIGPGSYKLPSVWDDHSVTISGQDRFQDQPVGETPGPGAYAQAAGSVKPRQCKENRPPSRDRARVGAQSNKEEMHPELGKAKEQVIQREKQLASAEERLQAQHMELQAAQLQVLDKDTQLKEAEQSLQAREADLEASRHMSEEKETALRELRKQLDDTKAALEEMQPELGTVKEQVLEKDTALLELQKQLNNTKAAWEEMHPELGKAKEQVIQREKQLASAEERLQAQHMELQAAQLQVSDKDTQLKEAVQRLQATEADLEVSRHMSEEKETALLELRKQLDDTKAELEDQTSQTLKSQQEARNQEEQVGTLSAQLKDVTETLNRTKAEIPLKEELTSFHTDLADALAAKDRLQSDLERLKFAEINANMTRAAKDRAESQVRDLKVDVEHWRRKAQSFERDEERMHRQSEDVVRMAQEAKELHHQNSQLLSTLQQFKTEWEMAMSEKNNLQETLNVYELNLQRATDQTAELMGHTNPKQKIRHMVNLKEENKELREQLKKAKQRISQMGASRKGEGLLEALASVTHSHSIGADQMSVPTNFGGADTPASTGVARTPKRPGTPTRKPMSARGARGSLPEEEMQLMLAEDERRLQIQERAVERVQIDFQHFIALIERAVLADDILEESPNPATLLERLRAVACKKNVLLPDKQPEPGMISSGEHAPPNCLTSATEPRGQSP